MELYNHLPQRLRTKPVENIHSLIVNEEASQIHPLYQPTIKDEGKYNYNDKDGYLNANIEEVISNITCNDTISLYPKNIIIKFFLNHM